MASSYLYSNAIACCCCCFYNDIQQDICQWQQQQIVVRLLKQEIKVIRQKAPHGGPIPRLGVTPGGPNLYH